MLPSTAPARTAADLPAAARDVPPDKSLGQVLAAVPPELPALGLAFAFQAWLLFVWLRLDTLPPRWDESLHLLMTERWRQFLVAPSVEHLTAALTRDAWKTTPGWLAFMGLFQALAGREVD